MTPSLARVISEFSEAVKEDSRLGIRDTDSGFGDRCRIAQSAALRLEFPHFEVRNSFSNAPIVTKNPAVSEKNV
jgi:hypothetical protein